jgi:hypothetical protein
MDAEDEGFNNSGTKGLQLQVKNQIAHFKETVRNSVTKSLKI